MNQISILMTWKPFHDGDNQAVSHTALNMQVLKSKPLERPDSGNGEAD
jgi:hypothetical protein